MSRSIRLVRPGGGQPIEIPVAESWDVPFIEVHLPALLKRTSGAGKHAARNALRHLEKAKRIASIDPDMAVFRLVTAQEEAATAVFRALQLRKQNYRGADSLKPKNHRHKIALAPFLDTIAEPLRETLKAKGLSVATIWTGADAPPYVVTAITNKTTGTVDLLPDPLNMTVVDYDGTLVNFGDAVRSAVNETTARAVEDAIVELANFRNKLLYAHSKGMREVQPPIEDAMILAERRVYAQLALFLMIALVPRPQSLVQQALDGFLSIMRVVDDES